MTAPRTLPSTVEGLTAAQPLEGATKPRTCPTCGHTTIPAIRCRCGHVAEVHNLAGDNQTRKACTHHEGPRCTPCRCKTFTPRTETSQ